MLNISKASLSLSSRPPRLSVENTPCCLHLSIIERDSIIQVGSPGPVYFSDISDRQCFCAILSFEPFYTVCVTKFSVLHLFDNRFPSFSVNHFSLAQNTVCIILLKSKGNNGCQKPSTFCNLIRLMIESMCARSMTLSDISDNKCFRYLILIFNTSQYSSFYKNMSLHTDLYI